MTRSVTSGVSSVEPKRTGRDASPGGTAATIRAVDRALRVLCTFSREAPVLGVTEISARVDLTKSTVHRLLQVLSARGLVTRAAGGHSYTLGYRVLALAQAIPGEATLRQVCRPHMVWLRDATQETVALYVVAGDVRMCLEEVESLRPLRMAAGVGRCFPLSAGAASRALLAGIPQSSELWQRAVAGLSAPQLAALAAQVAAVSREGYSLSLGETVAGAASVAAPIRDAMGQTLAALSVAGPASRFDETAASSYVAALRTAVSRIMTDLATAPAQREEADVSEMVGR